MKLNLVQFLSVENERILVSGINGRMLNPVNSSWIGNERTLVPGINLLMLRPSSQINELAQNMLRYRLTFRSLNFHPNQADDSGIRGKLNLKSLTNPPLEFPAFSCYFSNDGILPRFSAKNRRIPLPNHTVLVRKSLQGCHRAAGNFWLPVATSASRHRVGKTVRTLEESLDFFFFFLITITYTCVRLRHIRE